MKCALIVPAWVPEDLFPSKTASSQINYWQPLGMLYIAACLLRAGHQVKFFDGAFMNHAELLEAVGRFGPDFAGIYATAFGWDRAVKTAADLKRRNGRLFTCAGGPYPIAVQELCLADGGESFDAVVTGEGELTVCEMLERLGCGASLADVAGIAFRCGREIVKNPPRPLNEDLDCLPFPARELLGDAARYIPPPGTYRNQPVAVLITSRGCDRRCIYCFQIDRDRKSGVRGVRYRSIANVIQEIELLLSQGYREIKFLDDTLAADYDHAMELAQQIKARGLHFTWFASVCANQVDKPLLQAFRDAGCWAILMGAESGVQKNLNTLRKATTLDQLRRAVRAAKEVGLKVSTPFIFGIPGETFEEGLKTIGFAIELDPDLANFHAPPACRRGKLSTSAVHHLSNPKFCPIERGQLTVPLQKHPRWRRRAAAVDHPSALQAAPQRDRDLKPHRPGLGRLPRRQHHVHHHPGPPHASQPPAGIRRQKLSIEGSRRETCT